ncbi:MAG: 2TM domain-containing protein, partial [archaeon]|nr:2TM domain-containing protein [archaeon]
MTNNLYNENHSREQILEENRNDLKAHWKAYCFVNIFLFLLNLFTGMGYPWFLWPLMGWGIGMAIHALFYLVFAWDVENPEFLHHLIVVVVLSGFLMFVNAFTSWGYLNWCWWPISILFITVLIHFISRISNPPTPIKKTPRYNQYHRNELNNQPNQDINSVINNTIQNN